MATEGPLFHDGSQTTAAVTLTQFQACKLLAGTSRQTTPVTAAGERIYGIIQNKPLTGQATDVGFLGVSKCLAGAAISAGHTIAVNSAGKLVSATTNTHAVGQAIEAAVTNQIFAAMIYNQPMYLTNAGN